MVIHELMEKDRVQKNLTRSAQAKLVGVSRQTLLAWEQGQRPMDHKLGKLADYLGLDALDLARKLDGEAA